MENKRLRVKEQERERERERERESKMKRSWVANCFNHRYNNPTPNGLGRDKESERG
jgi:hypothetical protein